MFRRIKNAITGGNTNNKEERVYISPTQGDSKTLEDVLQSIRVIAEVSGEDPEEAVREYLQKRSK